MSEYAQKVALVTGAAGGMGYRIACDLINDGAQVVMFDIKDKPGQIPGTADQSIYVQADLTNEHAVADAVAQAV